MHQSLKNHRRGLTDLGASAGARPEEVCTQDFAGCSHAHLEGYLLFNRLLAAAILSAANAAGWTISLETSRRFI